MCDIILTEYEQDVYDIVKLNGPICINDILEISDQRDRQDKVPRYCCFYSTALQLQNKGVIERTFGSGNRNGTTWRVVES